MKNNNNLDRSTYIAIMSFSFFAFSGLSLIIYTVGLLNGIQSDNNILSNKSHISNLESNIKSTCPSSNADSFFKCTYEKLKKSSDTLQSNKELRAQQLSANSAVLGTIISLMSLIVSSIGIYLVKRTLDATLKAVEDTTKATEAMFDANRIASNSQRPWIEISNIKCKLSKGLFSNDDRLVSFQLSYDITNFGRTPATSLVDSVHFAEFEGPWVTYHEIYQMAYDNAPNIGRVIFPDQRQLVNRPHAWHNILITDDKGYFNISAVVYCTYRDEHGQKYITGVQIVICKNGSSENMMTSLNISGLTKEFVEVGLILENHGNIVT